MEHRTKEQWIAKTMASIDHLDSAKASPFLYQKIVNRFQARKGNIHSIEPQIAWRIAASITLLIGLNIFSIFHYNKTSDTSKNSNEFAREYFSYMSNNNIQF